VTSSWFFLSTLNLQRNAHLSGYKVAWVCGVHYLAQNEARFLAIVNKVTNYQILQKAWIIKLTERPSAPQELSLMEFRTMPMWMHVDDLGCSSSRVSAGTVSCLVGVPICNVVTRFHVDCYFVSNLTTSSLRSFPDVNRVRLHAPRFTQFTFLFIHSFLLL